MAWSISMSDDGWQQVQLGLEAIPHEKLVQAIADDRFEEVFEVAGIENAEAASSAEKRRLSVLPHDILVDRAMEVVKSNNTCDNGGFNVWIDKDGCDTVPLHGHPLALQ